MLNQGFYINLNNQFQSVYKHNRQGSIKTKHRYKEAMFRFLVFLAEVYRLEKISNIAPKHLRSYVDDMLDRGLEISYVKTELSAIRFFVDQISGAKYKLPSNKELGLERRQYGKTDRTWSNSEFNRALALAMQKELESYVAILCLARYAGLRLHECFRLGTSDAEMAVKTKILVVKGKGGLMRELPINLSIEIELLKLLKMTPRGHKLLVFPDDKAHLAMGRFENFLYDNREKIQDLGSTRPLTAHGLRHVYAVEKYKEFIAQGLSEKAARLKVAKLLGHGRDEVTKIYLASLDADTYGTNTHE